MIPSFDSDSDYSSSQSRFELLSGMPETPHERLERLGVKVYTMTGKEFLLAFIENIDLLREGQDIWFAACQAGQNRSAKINEFFRKLGTQPVSKKRTSEDPSAYGIAQTDMFLRLAAGQVIDDLLVPNDFYNGFNRLVLFVHTRETSEDIERLCQRVANSLEAMAQRTHLEKIPDLKVVIISEDEGEFGEMIAIVSRELEKESSPAAISLALQRS